MYWLPQHQMYLRQEIFVSEWLKFVSERWIHSITSIRATLMLRNFTSEYRGLQTYDLTLQIVKYHNYGYRRRSAQTQHDTNCQTRLEQSVLDV